MHRRRWGAFFVVVSAVGCGAPVGMYRPAPETVLGCKADQIQVQERTPAEHVLSGCGRKAVYACLSDVREQWASRRTVTSATTQRVRAWRYPNGAYDRADCVLDRDATARETTSGDATEREKSLDYQCDDCRGFTPRPVPPPSPHK